MLCAAINFVSSNMRNGNEHDGNSIAVSHHYSNGDV